MKEYIKLFNNHNEYTAFIQTEDFVKPNVSLCVQENEVHYNPDYSKDYLTFVALENGTFVFNPRNNNVINYSTDNGKTWTEGNTVQVNKGNKVIWKGTMTPSTSYKFGIGSFSATGNFDVQGNIMSLLFGDNYERQTDLTGKNDAFYLLFSYAKVVNAENLLLPATTLTNSCYQYMFGGCTNLISAPKLPATILTTSCYGGMFKDCTSLITAPKLPATTLANNCYQYMFYGCTNLMTAPELPATTLANVCYSGMFHGCISLTAAPELPATTLANYCYNDMFQGCTNLNYIKAMFTTTPSSNYTNNWVDDVAATGTFVKNTAAQWDVTGVNGVPEDWTVQTANI